ncbi:DUF3158 family protein [Pasteurella testudinis]|uniref:DUF3158 family protein n=1 Tax=Pasteurella testudinis TaxID=761 RepID=UPI00405958E3
MKKIKKSDAVNYSALDMGSYQNLIFQTPLNDGLKGIFKQFGSAEDYQVLHQNIFDARIELLNMSKNIVKCANAYPLNHLPLIFVADCNNSSGGRFLRWRNQQNNKGGQLAWENLVQSSEVPLELKKALIAVEKDRIAYNMQMSILNFIIRQARECEDKLNTAEKLLNEGSQ